MGRSKIAGLDVFRDYMAGLEGSYAVIGGTACDILLSDAGLPFRATRDLDTVLVADGHFKETARAIWALVHDGGYRCGWGQGEHTCFYRFTEPGVADYPKMIELFCGGTELPAHEEGIEAVPLHFDDEVSSLSAILLNDDYYQLLLEGVCTIDGVSILDAAHLIPFKTRAYLDLEERRMIEHDVDAHKVRKHKNDVFRLAQLLTGFESVNLSNSIASDMEQFVLKCLENPVNVKQIGVQGASFQDLIEVLTGAYKIDLRA